MYRIIRGGGPKNIRNYFFKWFIRFYAITTLVSFKVLPSWLDTLVPTFFLLLKSFPDLFSVDAVQDLQRFLFNFADISKTFPFHLAYTWVLLNPLNPELNPICYLLALLGAHHFLHVSRIRVKLLTFRLLMSYIYGAPILDVSRSHTTTQHSR